MKKVINGKLYDTSTAEKIGSWSHGSRRDFRRVREVLYRKKTGELFLHGSGGPLSRYAHRLSYNTWGSGETIIRVPDFDPKEWAAEHLDADTAARLLESAEG